MKSFAMLLVVSLAMAGVGWTQQATEGGSSERPEHAPENAFEYQGHWYALFESEVPISWDVALWECWRRGGHLACLETQDEDEFVREQLRTFPGACWAGGKMDHAAKGTPHLMWWLNGEPMDYQNIGSIPPRKCGYLMALLDAKEDHKWGFYTLKDPVMIYAYLCEWPKDREVAAEITPAYHNIRMLASHREGRQGARLQVEGLDVEDDHHDDEDDGGRSIEQILRMTWGGEEFKDHVVKGTSGSAPIPVRLEQTSLRGLVVQPLTRTRMAGKSSKLTATVFPLAGDEVAEVKYNQIIGPQMRTALTELVKFVQFRLQGWPRGKRIEISFSDKYVAKDGPSAALACALLLDSVLSGDALDEMVAITGDLNVDGSVQPVGGIEAKVRGAANSDCTLVVLPEANARQVRDYAIRNGLESLLQIPVFTAASYDDARSLVVAERDDSTASVLRAWAFVVDRLTEDSAALGSSKIRETLDEILRRTPNFLSATVLIELATQDAALQELSLPGSLAAIDEAAEALLTAAFYSLNGDGESAAEPPIDGAKLAEVKQALGILRPLLADRTDSFVESIAAAIEAVETKGDWKAAFEKMTEVYSELWEDPEVVESYFVP